MNTVLSTEFIATLEEIFGYKPKIRDPKRPVTRQVAARLAAEFVDGFCRLPSIPFEVPRDHTDKDGIAKENIYGVELMSLMGVMQDDQKNRFFPAELLSQEDANVMYARLAKFVGQNDCDSFVVTPQQMISSSAAVYSNMTSSLNPEGMMEFTPYPTHTPPWYVGVEQRAAGIPSTALGCVRIAVNTMSLCAPVLKISSPVMTECIYPYSTKQADGFYELFFDTKDAIRRIIRANLTVNPYESYDTGILRELHLKSLNTRYLRFGFELFGSNANVFAEVKYVGFFAQRESAEAYNHKHDGSATAPTASYTPATDELIKRIDKRILAKKKEIFSTASEVTPEDIEGTCYYISSIHGNDANDGLSPQTPWRSPAKLVVTNNAMDSYSTYRHVPKPGDGVFFERGSVFNAELKTRYTGNFVVNVADGVTYGAYGKGQKPVFTNCLHYDGDATWSPTEHPNIWRMDTPVDLPPTTDYSGYSDVGNMVVIDHSGKVGYGIKVLAPTPEEPFSGKGLTEDIGLVTTGFDTYVSGNIKFDGIHCLKNELEYFHNWADKHIYVYCNGDPNTKYAKFIFPKRGAGFYGHAKNVMIDNLSFRYIGAFGISVSDVKNFTVQHCTFECIGGSIQGGSTIYGGGFQNWCDCDGLYIHHCYADQSLDASFSTQGASRDTSVMNDIVIDDCAAIYSNSPVEIWNYASNKVISNMNVTGNLFGYAGYHFGNRKILKDACILQLGISPDQVLENAAFHGNVAIFSSSSCYWARPLLCRGDTNGTLLKNNIYVLSTKKMHLITAKDPRNDNFDRSRYYSPLTAENVDKLTALGIDVGSQFYYLDGYAFAGEEDGLYLPPYMKRPF